MPSNVINVDFRPIHPAVTRAVYDSATGAWTFTIGRPESGSHLPAPDPEQVPDAVRAALLDFAEPLRPAS